jgi:hypothetical protein
MLDGNRTESRMMESAALFLLKPIKAIAPTLLTIEVPLLAKSLIANTIYELKEGEKTRIIDNNEIYDIGKKYEKLD